MRENITALIRALAACAALLLATASLRGEVEPIAEPAAMTEINATLRLLRDLANPRPNADPAAVPVGKFAEEARNMRGHYQNLDQMIMRGDMANARMMVRQWISTTESPDLKNIYQSLLKHIDERLNSVQAAYATQIDDLLKRAADACRTAKTGSDLDGVTAEIEDLRQGGMPGEQRFSRLRRRLDGAVNFLQQWDRYLAAREAGSISGALQVLREMSSRDYGYRTQLLSSDELAKLRTELEYQASEQINSMVFAPQAVPAAGASIADWEKYLENVQSAYELVNASNFGSRSFTTRRRIDVLNNAMNYWMQMLYLERAGNIRGALQQIQNIESNAFVDGVVITAERLDAKRSNLAVMLANQSKEDRPMFKDIDAAIRDLRTPADLSAVSRRLVAYENFSGAGSDEVRSLRNDIHSLIRLATAVEDGRIGDYANYQYGVSGDLPHRWSSATREVRKQLVFRVIVVSTGLNDLGQPKEGESIDTLLLRVADEAVKKGDWRRVLTVLDALRRYAYSNSQPPLWLAGEIDSVQTFLAARQYEDAGEFAFAMSHYLAVLRNTGNHVPVKEASDRLAVLRKDHPELTTPTTQ